MKCTSCPARFKPAPWQVAARNHVCPSCRADAARSERAMLVADARFAGFKGGVDALDYLTAYREALGLKVPC